MRRGSTPLHTFTLSIDTAELLKIRITYHQLGKCVLTKTGDVIPSDPLRVDVESCLDDEVMT